MVDLDDYLRYDDYHDRDMTDEDRSNMDRRDKLRGSRILRDPS